MKKQGQKSKLPKPNDKPQFEKKSSKRAKINLSEKPKKWNDSKNENLLLLNERVEEDIIDESKDYLKKEYDEKFENMQLEIENLKKQNENENQKQNESLKKDIIEEVKELFKKQNDEKLENLQREHEKEIVLLKKEVRELKEKQHDQTATNETSDNLNFVHNTVVNPSEFEYIMNTEITIKEEPIE